MLISIEELINKSLPKHSSSDTLKKAVNETSIMRAAFSNRASVSLSENVKEVPFGVEMTFSDVQTILSLLK